MAKGGGRGRVGSKSGVIVKRGAGGKIMGSIKVGINNRGLTSVRGSGVKLSQARSIVASTRRTGGFKFVGGTATKMAAGSHSMAKSAARAKEGHSALSAGATARMHQRNINSAHTYSGFRGR